MYFAEYSNLKKNKEQKNPRRNFLNIHLSDFITILRTFTKNILQSFYCEEQQLFKGFAGVKCTPVNTSDERPLSGQQNG